VSAGRVPRVLVTGGAGFVGAALARELLRRGVEVCVLDDFSSGFPERLPEHSALSVFTADVARPGVLNAFLAEAEPYDHLVHLAARVGVRTVLADPEGCRAQNSAGVVALRGALERLAPAARPRVWAASTSEVYRARPSPLAESAPLRATDGRGRWAYAGSKLAGEHALDAVAALWPAALRPVHLRFFNVVGPGQSAAQGMVLPRFVEAARSGRALTVHGAGHQVRTFAHVDDVGGTLADLLACSSVPAGPLNVGGTARTSIEALALEVQRRAAQDGVGVAIECVDPRAELGADFVEIPWREPCLDRLAGTGVAVRRRSLRAIVDDTWARHTALAADCAGSGRPVCASPAC